MFWVQDVSGKRNKNDGSSTSSPEKDLHLRLELLFPSKQCQHQDLTQHFSNLQDTNPFFAYLQKIKQKHKSVMVQVFRNSQFLEYVHVSETKNVPRPRIVSTYPCTDASRPFLTGRLLLVSVYPGRVRA